MRYILHVVLLDANLFNEIRTADVGHTGRRGLTRLLVVKCETMRTEVRAPRATNVSGKQGARGLARLLVCSQK